MKLIKERSYTVNHGVTEERWIKYKHLSVSDSDPLGVVEGITKYTDPEIKDFIERSVISLEEALKESGVDSVTSFIAKNGEIEGFYKVILLSRESKNKYFVFITQLSRNNYAHIVKSGITATTNSTGCAIPFFASFEDAKRYIYSRKNKR